MKGVPPGLNEALLRYLSPREATILRLYFGLGDVEPLTLDEIGKVVGLTRERIRQIKEKALHRLRKQGLLEPSGKEPPMIADWKPGWLKVLYCVLPGGGILVSREEQEEDWEIRPAEGAATAIEERVRSEDDEF